MKRPKHIRPAPEVKSRGRADSLNTSLGGPPAYDCYCDNCAPRRISNFRAKCATCDGLTEMDQHHLAGGDCGEMPERIGTGVLHNLVMQEMAGEFGL